MAIERPDHHRVAVDVETLGATATTLDTLRGLPAWDGQESTGLSFGDSAAFDEASGYGDANDMATELAVGAVKQVEQASGRLAEAVGKAAELYGDTDTHSAAAVKVAARAMTTKDPKL